MQGSKRGWRRKAVREAIGPLRRGRPGSKRVFQGRRRAESLSYLCKCLSHLLQIYTVCATKPAEALNTYARVPGGECWLSFILLPSSAGQLNGPLIFIRLWFCRQMITRRFATAEHRTSNIQHRTSNIQHRTTSSSQRGTASCRVGGSALEPWPGTRKQNAPCLALWFNRRVARCQP